MTIVVLKSYLSWPSFSFNQLTMSWRTSLEGHSTSQILPCSSGGARRGMLQLRSCQARRQASCHLASLCRPTATLIRYSACFAAKALSVNSHLNTSVALRTESFMPFLSTPSASLLPFSLPLARLEPPEAAYELRRPPVSSVATLATDPVVRLPAIDPNKLLCIFCSWTFREEGTGFSAALKCEDIGSPNPTRMPPIE